MDDLGRTVTTESIELDWESNLEVWGGVSN